MNNLAEILTAIMTRIAEIERRQDSRVTQGKVAEVDPKAGTVRLRLGGTDAEPFLSAPVPYAQVAGALKVHSPPSVGQQMTLLSGAGDFRQGLAIPMTWSDANPSPSDKGDEHVLKFGSTTVTIKSGEIIVDATKITLNSSGGTAVLDSSGITLHGEEIANSGSSLTHNGKNVGDSHLHTGVLPGPSLTGPPA